MTEEISVAPTEMDYLKRQAKVMGITFSNNIGVDALRKKIREKLEKVTDEEEFANAAEERYAREEAATKEANKLIRLSISCLNPAKINVEAEIWNARNKAYGTITRVVPTKVDAWHVPNAIYMLMKEAKYLTVRKRKTPMGDTQDLVELPEYSLVELPPLTEEEIAELKAISAATEGM